MAILNSAKQRYSCKHFDQTRKIPPKTFRELEEIVRLCPSSINIQPWHFLVTDNDEGKQRITQATQGFFSFNEKKILEASHVMVMCVKTDMGDEHLDNIAIKENNDGRYKSEKIMQRAKEVRAWFFNEYSKDPAVLKSWAIHQVYLNLGNTLLAAADMGIDTLAIEGFDKDELSNALNLKAQNLEPVVIIAFGYSTIDDFNKSLPKSRFDLDEIFTHF